MKHCPKCDTTKPTGMFGPNKTKRSGLDNYCRTCRKEYGANWYKNGSEDPEWMDERRADARAWAKANPEKVRAGNDRLKEYRLKYYKERRENEPGYREESNRSTYKWRKTPKGRASRANTKAAEEARKRDNYREPVNKEEIMRRDNYICHICKKRVSRAKMSLDHLIPILHGGPHTSWNVAVAHRSCNSKRGAGRIPAQLRLHI
ncbi:hypothetical protein LCGC14_2545040 [marine sediment metagenome]|uniref:C2H2-type domain-containing protein n=1 Tax=marine sediment metagenome TaxID=412755 RepID=A0A0F9AQ08_9ZZZZ